MKIGGDWYNCPNFIKCQGKLAMGSDGRAGDVWFRSIPNPTLPGGSYAGGMVVKGVSKVWHLHAGCCVLRPKLLGAAAT